MVTLKKRTIHSGSWVLFGHLFSQILRLSSNLILTRLLVPDMFGVMAMVTVIIGGISMFSDVGLLQNIVRSKRGDDPAFLNTAWTIQIIRGFVIFVIALFASFGLYFAIQNGVVNSNTVYGNSDLPLILAIVSISAVISGFNSIHIHTLNRKLMLSKVVTLEVVSQIVGLVFMLLWAWFSPDIWSLVIGAIISCIAKMLLSHYMRLGPQCKFQWDKSAAYEVLNFGKWIFISSILGFFLNQGDRVLLGGLITPNLLGIYTIAFFLSNALKDVFSKLISSVFFPVLAEVIRNNPDKIESVYYNIRLKIDFVTMPTAGLLFSAGGLIVNLLYDSRYDDAAWMLELLSISIISIGFMLADQLLLSYGKPKYVTLMILVQVLGLYVFVPLSFQHYGLTGAIVAIALNPLLKVFVTMFVLQKTCFISWYREFRLFPLVGVGYLLGEQIQKLFVFIQ